LFTTINSYEGSRTNIPAIKKETGAQAEKPDPTASLRALQ